MITRVISGGQTGTEATRFLVAEVLRRQRN